MSRSEDTKLTLLEICNMDASDFNNLLLHTAKPLDSGIFIKMGEGLSFDSENKDSFSLIKRPQKK